MLTSFEKLSDDKKEMILNICMDAFIQNGYAFANTVDIAKQCGIAKGSLFHYFGNKKSLFLYLVRMCIDRVMDITVIGMSGIKGKSYLDRVRESVQIKMALPAQCPRETAFLTKAFAERGHEASGELQAMAIEYATKTRELNTRYIGNIEPELIREGIDVKDAQLFVQSNFDSITQRLMQQYARNPHELLNKPEILSLELEKVINFILNGIGK